MDCRTCEPTLIDLVHDELATDAAADARAHLSECASCRASFERLVAARKLADGLELERPPQAVSARLLQLAEARAGELRAQAAPRSAPPTLARRLLDFVARFAMGRQVGMATIMLLIVAVGLWSLPRMRHEPVAGGTIVDADQEEAAPSPGVEPADRLALKVDPRSRRIRSSDGQDELASSAVPAAPAVGAVPTAELAPGVPAKGDDDPLARLDDIDDLLGDKLEGAGAATSASAAAGPARSQRDSESGSREGVLGRLAAADAPAEERAEAEASASLRERKAEPPAPAPFPANQQAFAEADVADLSEASREAAPAQNATQQAPSPKAKRSTQVGRQTAGSGMQRPAGAQAPAAPSAAPPTQADELMLQRYRSSGGSKTEQTKVQAQVSLLESARSLARSRGCNAALPSYERVIAAAPGSADAGAALIDMALCKRSLGLESEAQVLLERAATIPATAPRARTLLQTP